MSIKNTKRNVRSIYSIKYVTFAKVLQDLKRCYSAKKKKKSDNTLHRHAGIRVLNGRRSFLAIEIHVGNSDLGSHLFRLIKKSLI